MGQESQKTPKAAVKTAPVQGDLERLCPSCGGEMYVATRRSLNIVMSGPAGECDVETSDDRTGSDLICSDCSYRERVEDLV